MSKWIDLDLAERRVVLQSVEDKEKLQQVAAIEKDWWVTAVLKALFQTSCKDALSFKGGTSLSKGWGIIERLSEDINCYTNRRRCHRHGGQRGIAGLRG